MEYENFSLMALASGIAVTYTASYFLGRLVLKKIIKRDLSSLPFSVTLPIYIAFGLNLLIIVYFASAVFVLSALTPLLILLVSLLATLPRHAGQRLEFSKLRNLAKSVNLVPLTLFGLALLLFTISANYMQWPPPGDVMLTHGPMVGLVEYHGKVPVTLDPLVKNETLQYPPGFAVLVATLNTFLRLYPAQAVLLAATCIVALIPAIIYSLTFVLTRSIIFSSLGFLSVFAIHPASLATWIVGYFYNGPYPNLMGYLLIFTFATLVATIEQSQCAKDVFAKQLISLGIIVFISLILLYPSFALVICLFVPICFMVLAFSCRHNISNYISIVLQSIQRTNRKILILKVLSTISLICLASLMLLTYARLYLPIGAQASRAFELPFYDYTISPYFFVDHLNGILIIVAGFISSYFIVRKHTFGLPILYLIVLIPAIISLNSQLFPYIAYFLPSRSIIICSVLSWPLVLACIKSGT